MRRARPALAGALAVAILTALGAAAPAGATAGGPAAPPRLAATGRPPDAAVASLLPPGLGPGAHAAVGALLTLATEAAGRAAAARVGRAVLPSLAVAEGPRAAGPAAPRWAAVDVAGARVAGLLPPGAPFRPDGPVSPAVWAATLRRALGAAPAATPPPSTGAVSRGRAVEALLSAFGLETAARALARATIPLPHHRLAAAARGPLALAVRLGIVRGVGPGGLEARQALTGAQMAALLVRTLLLERMARQALDLLGLALRARLHPGAAVPAALAPVELLARNTPQLAPLRHLLPAGPGVRRLVGPTPGDPRETGALYVPAGPGAAPGVLFVNGVVPGGWADPEVAAAARSLAELGLTVYVPNLPGLRRERLTTRMLPALEGDARWLAGSPHVRPGGVALFGVSMGASLALVAAARPALRPALRGVVGVAPYARVRDLLEVATTGVGPGVHRARAPFRPDAWTRWVLARSLVGTVREPASRLRILGLLGAAPAFHPLAPFRRSPPPAGLSPGARAWWRLWGNASPARFPALYAALPARIRATLRALSPATTVDRIDVPVLLASPLSDTAFPPAEGVILARLAPARVRLVRTSALEHAYPRLGDSLVGFWRFWHFARRAMALVGGPGPAPGGAGAAVRHGAAATARSPRTAGAAAPAGEQRLGQPAGPGPAAGHPAPARSGHA